MTSAEQLQWLVDRAQISDLLLSFAHSVDAHDHAQYTANFTDDAVLELPFGCFEGRATIAAMDQPVAEMATHHISANHAIDIDGDTARTRSYLIATHVFDRGNPRDHAQAGGWYDCELRRTAAGWRFARVRLSIVWETAAMIRDGAEAPAPVGGPA
jgi:ketosteroid isomerase-like protein